MSLVSNRYLVEHVGIKENHKRKSKSMKISANLYLRKKHIKESSLVTV